MHMSYWFDTAVGDFLFKGYTITSNSGLISTCFGLASLAVLFEAIKVYLVSVKQKADTVVETSIQKEERCPNERSSLMRSSQEIHKTTRRRFIAMLHQMAWYSVQNIIGYILMLSVMTYNGYFTIAVCLGAGLGYMVFGGDLLEIGLKNGGIRRPKRECPVCMNKAQSPESPQDGQQGSSIMSEVAQGLVQSVILDSEEEAAPGRSTEVSTVEVHRVQ